MIRAWLIFVLCSLHLFVSQLYRTTNAVLAPWLINDLHLDTEGLRGRDVMNENAEYGDGSWKLEVGHWS